MEPGAIIEFSTSSEHRLGVVTGAVGKKKLIVQLVGGVEMRPSVKDVTFELGRVRDAEDSAGNERALAKAAEELEGLAGEVELELAWEMAAELGEAMTAAELADLIFGDERPVVVLAVLRALRDDAVYFKRRKDSFEARPEDQVQQLMEQRAAAARKAEELAAFVDAIRDIMDTPEVERTARIQEHERDDSFRGRMTLLKEYATQGDDYPRKSQAITVLDDLEGALGEELRGKDSMRAFHLMVELGVWARHENLWLHRFHVNPTFSAELVEQAEALASGEWTPEPWRRDLSALTCYSIDDASTLDIDDAVSCQPHIDGGWEVGIHIADPDTVVTADTPLDEEARRRGTSIYLPTGTIPMFPLALSEGRMSLVAGALRPAITTRVRFSEDLEIIETEVFASTIRVTERLTYDTVNEVLETEERTMRGAILGDLSYLASELYQQRLMDGAVIFDIPDAKVRVELDGGDARISVGAEDTETPAHTLVSELMILANHVMGLFCERHDIPVVYRRQLPPEEPLVDEETERLPEGLARTFSMLRKMKRADITTEPAAHFALGLSVYVQATSPIRRYGDLICQRQVKAFLAGDPLPYDAEQLMHVAATVENTAREASLIERETTRYWTLHFLKSKQRETFKATVIGHRGDDGTTASLFLDDCGFTANCKFRKAPDLGASVEVRPHRVDPRGDYLQLREA